MHKVSEIPLERHFEDRIKDILSVTNEIILGKEHEVMLCVCCILAGGHILIEDVPGVGKTTLVKTLAKAIGLQTQRIQFTNDMLPSDILGTNIFDESQKAFIIQKGPIFSQLIIADELNRANPKTQSAFLQAMEERQITIEGQSFDLPPTFMVVATQNPMDHAGTFPLPESQLDRFLMKIHIGFPSSKMEKKLLAGEKRIDLIEQLKPIISSDELLQIQTEVQKVHVSDAIINYIQKLLHQSRQTIDGKNGLSPRSGIGLISAAKAWSYLQGRKMVLPEDVQEVSISVMSHRLNHNDDTGESGIQRANEIIQTVKVD